MFKTVPRLSRSMGRKYFTVQPYNPGTNLACVQTSPNAKSNDISRLNRANREEWSFLFCVPFPQCHASVKWNGKFRSGGSNRSKWSTSGGGPEYSVQNEPKTGGADPGFWNGGWKYFKKSQKIKYYFNLWGIGKKKERRGLRKRMGENSPISPPPDPRLNGPLHMNSYRNLPKFWLNGKHLQVHISEKNIGQYWTSCGT